MREEVAPVREAVTGVIDDVGTCLEHHPKRVGPSGQVSPLRFRRLPFAPAFSKARFRFERGLGF